MLLKIIHYNENSYRKLVVSCHKAFKAFILHFLSLLFSCSFLVSFSYFVCFPTSYIPPPPFSTSPPPPYTELRRGQAVLDYDGTTPEELSLMIHEVLFMF